MIITEIISHETIGFLSQKNKDKEESHLASQSFASGEIYISTMLDTLLCSAYFNPKIINILNQLIMGNANLTSKEKKLYNIMKLQQSNLFLVEIPIKYQQKTFGYLFKCLAQEYKILCIGVYRDLTHLEEVNNNSRPYVYLKPPNNENDFLIQTNDKAYVLTSKFPSQSNILFPT